VTSHVISPLDEEFIKDFLDFKESFEKEMGLDMLSAISTDVYSTAKKIMKKPKIEKKP